MKLKEYFEAQKSIKTSDFQKIEIYQSFLVKSNKIPLYSRFSFYVKVGSYTLVILFLVFSFYHPFLNDNESITNPNISYVGTGYFVQKENLILNQEQFKAQADYIGKVIESNGDFKIVKNGQEIVSNDISDGDTILLMKDAKLKFQINSGAIGYIEGPAKLNIKSLQDETNKYVVNLLEGNLFEIKTENKQPDNLIVKADDFEIESKKLGTDIDLKITSDGNKKIVENRGSDVIVKKIVKDEKKIAALKQNQKAEVNEDIKILAEVKKITQQLKNKDISISYSLSGDNVSGETTIDSVSGEDLSLNVDVKAILPEKDLESLKDLLYPTFVMKDVEDVSVNYLNGDKFAFDISYNNLSDRIKKAYNLFGFNIDSSILEYKIKMGNAGLEELYVMTDQLLAKINNSYYVPTQYTQRLTSLLSWLVILKQRHFGEFQSQPIEFGQIFDKLDIVKFKNNLIIK